MIGGRWTWLALVTLAGCSSSKKTAATTDAAVFCPDTVTDTAGAACVNGQKPCYPEYTCGFASVTATCTCSGGKWGCVDVTGTMLMSSSDTPNCPAVTTDAGPCPASYASAVGAACSEIGRLCAYQPKCDAAMYDQCECFPGAEGDAGFGPRFECSSACGM